MININIREEQDFGKLRTYEKYKPLSEDGEYNTIDININILCDIKFTKVLSPLMLGCNNITVNGNDRTLTSLKIDTPNNNSGLFGEVNSIMINNLNIVTSVSRGNKMSGLLVGSCKEYAIFYNVNVIDSMVVSKGLAGGLVGFSKEVYINNCLMDALVTGVDYVGGYCGSCLNYNENDSIKSPTILVMGNNHGESVGHCKNINISNEEDIEFKRRNH